MEIAKHEFIKPSIQLNPIFDLGALLSKHLNEVQQLISSEKLIRLSKEHSELEKKEIDIGLNVFQIVSDTYYRENFHSDILQAILSPNGKHKEGYLFLNLFISFLNRHSRNGWIKKSEYQNTIVERETGRIDILIKDLTSKKAIIIENKIYGASDMDRQIPRYVEYIKNQGFSVDSIVYLVLSGNKQPSTHDWTLSEIASILPKMFYISAYNETSEDLFNGWLSKCEKQTNNIDTLFLLRQYNNLISYLGGKNMNKPLMEEFLKNMLIDDNYNKAIALNSMFQDLIIYRRDKIIDKFKFDCSPFTRVYDWKHYAVLDNCTFNDIRFAIDIIVEQDMYRFQFFVRSYDSKTGRINPATTFLQENNLIDSFFESGDRWEKQFLFPSQEDALYGYITTFKAILKDYTATTTINEQ
ncbi:hypothetical protein AAE02nite_42210 [Adhaeribacter aerolatus]|uniref:Uncharacterized protein n=1 Tax=Adhaeribacter aerolatus TaxID=670289 RepID=A0A512B436_9BACT|nr:PD-(D/E)XK nuclease family protein [Adhaeribacter aerolatus]GEO06557.1 hypothetical protein AAE02nite_42210 [Adhaeribacter aerolatus]